mmetsp:Transcript_37885/g.103424  ORF Transcript_37885/g.103424 Transcript_37885/m.103424 type:complete len:247 (-) Transcript_37885:79-819(-)
MDGRNIPSDGGDEDAGPTCAICMDRMREDDQTTLATCGHTFHTRCVSEYRQRLKLGSEACPLCRAPMPARPETLFDDATRALVNINLRVKFGEFSWDFLPIMFREKADSALRDLEQASESGLSSASFQMACVYLNGHGRPPSEAEARRWLQRALSQDPRNAGAAYEMAVLLGAESRRHETVDLVGQYNEPAEPQAIAHRLAMQARSLHVQAASNNHAGSQKWLGDEARSKGDLHGARDLYTLAVGY